jgi:hypothetical protein
LAQLLIGDSGAGLVGEALHFDYEAGLSCGGPGDLIQLGLGVGAERSLIDREQYGFRLHHLVLVHAFHGALDLRAALIGPLETLFGEGLGAIGCGLRSIGALAGPLGGLARCNGFCVGIGQAFLSAGQIGRQGVDLLAVLANLLGLFAQLGVLFGILALGSRYSGFHGGYGLGNILLRSATGSREGQYQGACHHQSRFHIKFPFQNWPQLNAIIKADLRAGGARFRALGGADTGDRRPREQPRDPVRKPLQTKVG